MESIQNPKDIQALATKLHRQGQRIALVPTMGFLHEGHLALVDEAKKQADFTVMSIFVNPTQFGAGEDFEKYPRDLNRDQKLAQARGVDVLFTPATEQVYLEADQTTVIVTELTRGLCSPFRPGHFRGVTTVVIKLFNMVQPDLAVFGEKDYQQLKVIQRMVYDLHLPIKIIGVPTLREKDGLALSSRNTYLTKEERSEALHLSQALKQAQNMVHEGIHSTDKISQAVHQILQSGKNTTIDYAEIVDPETLESLDKIENQARLIMAIRINGKRLIDNGPLG